MKPFLYLDGIENYTISIRGWYYSKGATVLKKHVGTRLVSIPQTILSVIFSVGLQIPRGISSIGAGVFGWEGKKVLSGCSDIASATVQALILPFFGFAGVLSPESSDDGLQWIIDRVAIKNVVISPQEDQGEENQFIKDSRHFFNEGIPEQAPSNAYRSGITGFFRGICLVPAALIAYPAKSISSFIDRDFKESGHYLAVSIMALFAPFTAFIALKNRNLATLHNRYMRVIVPKKLPADPLQ